MIYLAEYSIWSVLRKKVYLSKIADVDKLKTRLIDEWARSLTSRSLMPLSASSIVI